MDILSQIQQPNDLNNYYMKPTILDGIKIYPVKLFMYDTFKIIVNKTILLDMPKLNNKMSLEIDIAKIEGQIDRSVKFKKLPHSHLFDYITDMCDACLIDVSLVETLKKFSKEEIDMFATSNPNVYEKIELYDKGGLTIYIDLMVKLIEFVCNEFSYEEYMKKNYNLSELFDCAENKVSYRDKTFIISNSKGEKIGEINRDNFYDFRRIVMDSNIMFEPRIAPNKRSQDQIDRDIYARLGRDETSIESMLAITDTNIPLEDITYYRLKADFKSTIRKMEYVNATIYRANGNKTKGGGEIPIPNLLEPLKLTDNPYMDMLKENKETELDRMCR